MGDRRVPESDDPSWRMRLSRYLTTDRGRGRAHELPTDELGPGRELYRTVVENIHDLVSLLDLEGQIVYASPSHEHVLGFTPAELVGRSVVDLLHPDDLEEAGTRLGEAAAGAVTTETTTRVRRKDGAWVLVEGLATPIHGSHGALSMILTTSRDVTAKHAAEEALRTAERKYRSLVEQLPLVTYIDALDSGSPNIYTSPQIEPLLGYSTEEWSGDPELFVKTLHPDDRERVLAEHAWTHATGDPLKSEYRLIARNGKVVWLQDEAVVVRDEEGNPLFLQGYLLDITERKATEQALAERENLLQAIVETDPECVKLIAPDGTLLEMNPAGLEMIEADSLDQVAGRDLSELVAPADRAAFKELTRIALAGGSGRLEFDLVGLKGTRRRLETHAVPLRTTGGEVRAALSVTRDVTQHRRLEEQLVQSQKMEAVGRLAGGIAHDFNNLLTGILGYSDILRDGLADDDPLRADADEVKKAADRAASLTRQLLAFSRRQVLRPRVIDLNTIVDEMERMLRPLIGEDVELVTACSAEVGRVEADPGQIEQVIANLVVNARDAMPNGGRLVIATADSDVDEEHARAHVAEMTPGPYVLLSVTDSGVGIEPEALGHLFEPFFTTKDVGKGTGLGLATVYGIVKQSGGYIWVYSEPGRGTSFQIYLPRVERVVEALAEAGAPPVETGNETVLVVEDERLVRNLISEELSRRGYEVLAAANGVDALHLARGHDGRIDVVVSDVVMPEMGGPELTRELIALLPGIRVVYMSGYSELAVTDDIGPWPLLQKPFNARLLAGKIREVLDVAPAA
jgi:two-component system cell cycle sensor histidine kinase/response regulator CckA